MSLYALPVSVSDLTTLQNGIQFFTNAPEATAETALINNPPFSTTVFSYAQQLLAANVALSQVAMADFALMMGVTDTTAHLAAISTQFLPAQQAFAVAHNFDPGVFDAEAYGLAIASINNGNNAFATGFGSLSISAFAASFSTITGTSAAAIEQFVNNWIAFFTIDPSAHPGISAQLAAYGAAAGDALGVALENTSGAQVQMLVHNALIDDAEGQYIVGVSLSGEPTPTPLQAMGPPFLAAHWTGIRASDGINLGWYPPDNALAVGPSNVVTLENSAIRWTDLEGGNATERTLAQFFSPVTSDSFIGDVRAAYDQVNHRFVVAADDFTTNHSQILLAVSRDANPNDGWYFQAVSTAYTVNGQQTWADYPMLSIDGSYIYISTNQFNASGQFVANELTILSDNVNGNGLYAGGTSPVQAMQYGSFTYQPVADPNGGIFDVAYLLGSHSLSIGHSIGTGVFLGPVSVNLGSIDAGNGDYTASQPNTSTLLDASDSRVESAVVVRGHLYAVFEVAPSAGSPAAVHWVDVNVSNPASPVLVAQGNILGSPISAGAATFNGSIAVDGNGDVLINFNASGSNLMPGDYFVVRRATDPAGVFSAPLLYQASNSTYQDPAHDAVSRWGDYSSAVADPHNANGFWISSEYANGSNSWATAVAQVIVPSGPSPVVVQNVTPTISLTGVAEDVGAHTLV